MNIIQLYKSSKCVKICFGQEREFLNTHLLMHVFHRGIIVYPIKKLPKRVPTFFAHTEIKNNFDS